MAWKEALAALPLLILRASFVSLVRQVKHIAPLRRSLAKLSLPLLRLVLGKQSFPFPFPLKAEASL